MSAQSHAQKPQEAPGPHESPGKGSTPIPEGSDGFWGLVDDAKGPVGTLTKGAQRLARGYPPPLLSRLERGDWEQEAYVALWEVWCKYGEAVSRGHMRSLGIKAVRWRFSKVLRAGLPMGAGRRTGRATVRIVSLDKEEG